MSESIVIAVSGMKCGGCENTINKALLAIEGVVSANASHLEKTVTVDFDAATTSVQAIEDAIEDAGFKLD